MKIFKGYVYYHKSPVRKYYIGATMQMPEARWRDGKGYKKTGLESAIKEFGWCNFEHCVLEKVEHESKEKLREILNNRERFYISKFNSVENGYNLTTGGTNGSEFCCKSKQSLSKSRQGRKPCLGKIPSEETREKMRNARFDNPHPAYRKVRHNPTGLIYNSIFQAARIYGLHRDTVWKHCTGKIKGGVFSYCEENLCAR